MATLLLRLAAPLQAWGCNSKFNTRNTEREPTKSGVIGMIAAALGIQRDGDPDALLPLTGLRFGVRVEKEGRLIQDYHIARPDGKDPYVTNRYYLSDAVFLAGLESDDTALLESIGNAILHPVYPMFLGRRACPVTLPVYLNISEQNLVDALINAAALTDAKPLRIVYEVTTGGVVVQDVPISFSQLHRQHGYRMKKEEILYNDHDAFAELRRDE